MLKIDTVAVSLFFVFWLHSRGLMAWGCQPIRACFSGFLTNQSSSNPTMLCIPIMDVLMKQLATISTQLDVVNTLGKQFSLLNITYP